MKELMISIKQKWVEKICRGEKTVEVRKTRPKCETPFKVYIYCTKDKPTFTQSAFCDDVANGKVVGEFVCDRIVKFENSWYDPAFSETSDLSCVGWEELAIYIGKKDFGYGWHITDLVVYDKPRELGDFVSASVVNTDWRGNRSKKITRPFQSWGYVQSIEPRQTADTE